MAYASDLREASHGDWGSFTKSVGPYRIKEAVGLGGMGIVVGASLNPWSAGGTKFRFNDERPDNDRLQERFRHGAALQSELRHPLCGAGL